MTRAQAAREVVWSGEPGPLRHQCGVGWRYHATFGPPDGAPSALDCHLVHGNTRRRRLGARSKIRYRLSSGTVATFNSTSSLCVLHTFLRARAASLRRDCSVLRSESFLCCPTPSLSAYPRSSETRCPRAYPGLLFLPLSLHHYTCRMRIVVRSW